MYGGERDEFFEAFELTDDQGPVCCNTPVSIGSGWSDDRDISTYPMDRRTRHIDGTVPSPAGTPHLGFSRYDSGKPTVHA